MNSIYAGLDIAKLSLELHFQNRSHSLPNTPAGHRRLVRLLQAAAQPVQLICEASGGYEQPLVQALHAAQLPVSILQPARARQFAAAQGQLAKTDRIDAAMLARYGQLLQPRPLTPPSPAQGRLRELSRRRSQLQDLLQLAVQQTRSISLIELRRQATALVRQLKKQIAQIESLLAAQIQKQSALSLRSARLQSVAGVGTITATVLLAEMPELGQLNRQQAAALAGVAPFCRDSGRWRGKRWISGGRPALRKALYMAALVASRYNPHLRSRYQLLRARGKAPKVALVALMRHLIIYLNALLKSPLAS
jgi:transposase